MKSNLNYETVKVNKIIFNKNLEQQVDFEYQLPDYCTGIFKVLQFCLEPHISSCRASNKQFIIDGNATLKLIYIDEEGGDIKAIHQNIPFSKTVDLEEEITNSILFYNVKTSYKNCKIVSPKKIDVKATLVMSIKVQSQKQESILSGSDDKNLQLKYVPVTITSDQAWNFQQFNINEQIELNSVAKDILDVKIKISDDECKLISNKIISKAVAEIEILYCGEAKNNPILEKTSIALNNIVDMPNVNEKFLYSLKYDVTSLNFEILQEGKVLNVEADVVINSYGSLSEKLKIVTDAFSTKFEITSKNKEFNPSTIVSSINENISVEEEIFKINLNKVFDVDAKIIDLTYVQNKDSVEFTAKLNLNVLGCNSEGTLESFEKLLPIKFKINNEQNDLNYSNINVNDISILKVGYILKEDDSLEVKVNFNLKGFVFTSGNLVTLTDITLDENKIKEKSKAALTLYYPKFGDKVWNIAKRFCTSPKAIIEANNLENDVIENETMLIIPIV